MLMLNRQISNKSQLRFFEIAAALLFALSLSATARGQGCFICIKPALDMPVTLEKGTVRSPEFTVKHKQYMIELQVDNTFPMGQLECMIGIHQAWQPDHCEMLGYHLAVEAEWTLYAEGQVVAHGIVQGKDQHFEFSSHHMIRYLATFEGEKKKKYVLEVTFTKDGTALRPANPHIVIDLTPGLYM